jgi:SAM-dependent methyltransferase
VPIIFADYAADIAASASASQPASVLELAAGTGVVTRRLRDELPATARLIATDLQPEMLEIARAKFSDGERVEFQAVDATDLPYADETFDTVVCQFGVMFFPDRDRSYREVYRVLRRGGRYVFNIWDSHERNAFARIANAIVCDAFPDDPPGFMKIPFSYASDSAEESLLAAGFANVAVSAVTKRKDVPDPVSFARGLFFGSPLAGQVRARGALDERRFVDALADRFRSEFGEPGTMTMTAIVISADKP